MFQTGFFLKNPGDTNMVYLIHADFEPFPPGGPRVIGKYLFYTTVDLKANNGAGKVLAKNQILLQGARINTPAATRHANGRDWWILVSDMDTHRHYTFLLTPQGFSGPAVQDIGSYALVGPDGVGWNGGSKFSTTGKYFVHLLPETGFSVFDFDRCSGQLSNERRVNYINRPLRRISGGSGLEFGDNDRYVYVSSSHIISESTHPAAIPSSVPFMIQYDLQEPDWPMSGDTINVPPPGPYTFFNIVDEFLLGSATGPDGRIYVTYLGGSYCTVQYPDKKGKASVFKKDSPDFKNNIYRGIPYLPNYRLGPLDGSPCDTLGLNNVPVANFRMDTPDSNDLQTRYFYNLAHHEPATWRWDFGDGSPRSTDTSALHTYAKPGKYRVCLTVSNRYGEDTYCREVYVGVTAAEEARAAAGTIEIVPNPADEGTAIYLPDAPASNLPARLSVTDAVGRVVLSRPFSRQLAEVEVRSWPPGVYMVRVEQADGAVRTAKLVVAR